MLQGTRPACICFHCTRSIGLRKTWKSALRPPFPRFFCEVGTAGAPPQTRDFYLPSACKGARTKLVGAGRKRVGRGSSSQDVARALCHDQPPAKQKVSTPV